jgi:hypothetical protein
VTFQVFPDFSFRLSSGERIDVFSHRPCSQEQYAAKAKILFTFKHRNRRFDFMILYEIWGMGMIREMDNNFPFFLRAFSLNGIFKM